MVSRQSSPARNRWDAGSIRALRMFMDVSQSVFARYLGVRQQTVSEWETGVYRPRGASGTLLSMVAEQAGFRYNPLTKEREPAHTPAYRRAPAGPAVSITPAAPVQLGFAPNSGSLAGLTPPPHTVTGTAPRPSGAVEQDDTPQDSSVQRGYIPYAPPAEREASRHAGPGPSSGSRRGSVAF